MLFDLFLAGLSLKLGGKLAKGPYLPQTLEGLGKTTKAVVKINYLIKYFIHLQSIPPLLTGISTKLSFSNIL